MHGKLYLIPCVLSDGTQFDSIPSGVSDRIARIKYFLVENVRTARRFISSLSKDIVIDDLEFTLFDKDAGEEILKPILDIIKNGNDIGVMSEAGCPGIADPGALAVAFAHKNNIEVVPMVGPSSILMALMASGFNGQKFAFHGYLPIDKTERRKALAQLEKESHSKNQTQIFIETPFRNDALLKDLLETCRAGTMLCIASNITALEQKIHTKTIDQWKQNVPGLHKVPVVFLLYGG